jgi:hypothetical protein
VVRDARAVLISYQKYLAEVDGRSVTLRELIAGKHWPGKWHEHVGQFLARGSNDTLILRYEDLASDNPPLEAIGRFIDRPPLRPFDVSFADLSSISPKIFPTGHNRVGIETIERQCRWLFWSRCGEMMRAMGYLPQTGNGAARAFFEDPALYFGTVMRPAIRSLLTGR